ncbi:hypothetical protein [uncultured Brachyspira sp.]|uniref:hypothetical protein n=1 Tax=uncultured Brachyspira sp. TaxID=221953 RepID=UPI00262BB3A0|nr:hypothetical protein [uncultured Brachyspira sp.]
MFENILIVLVLILFLCTDFDELLFNILSNIFDLIKAAILFILFLKRVIVGTFCNFLYDILVEPIIYIFGIIKNSFK